MAELKLDMKTVSINTAAAKAKVLLVVKDAMEQVAEQMGDLIKREIAHNGNGSSIMRNDAINMVKTMIKEANYEKVIYESGIDPTTLAGCAFDMRVRVLTVLTGNQHSGPLVSKPGASTFKKNVTGPSASRAANVYPLPEGFNQNFDLTAQGMDNI